MFTNLEIRVLICNRDVDMGLNMVKSLRRYNQFNNIPIYFHNDGSLDVESKHSLLEIENSFIVDREYADEIVKNYIHQYKSCHKYRFDNIRIFNNTKIKLFDFHLLSKSKNILCIDSDVLIINEPIEIIKLIENSTPFYFPDFQNSYSFCKTTKANVLDNVNVGIFYIPSNEYYDINAIEYALNDLFTIGITNGGWIEQSAWSHMFYKNGNYISLNKEKYQIPNPYDKTSDNIEALHFVGHPPIRRLYDDFLK